MPHDHGRNIRPDYQTWMRMIESWNRRDADFSDTYTTDDHGVFARLAASGEVKVLKSNVSSYQRQTMLVKVKGDGSSKKKRKRRAAYLLVDVFEDHPVHVFVKSDSISGLTKAVLLATPVDREDEELLEEIGGEGPRWDEA